MGSIFMLFMFNPTDNHKVFVIIPAYNEHKVIHSVASKVIEKGYSVVIVDDGSLNSMHPLVSDLPVYFLRHRVNLGQGAAIQTGMEFALRKNATYIITFDGDGQHDVEDIGKLLPNALEYDVILGSRFMKGAVHNMPGGRKTVLQLARFLNYLFTGLFLTDAHNGFRIISARAARVIKLKENGMAHATEILSCIKKNKLKYAELPVSIHYSDYSRQKGQTVWGSFRIFFDLLLNKVFK